MKLIRKSLDWSEKLLTYVGMLFLVGMVLIVSMTVFTRYVLNFTFRWTDELALLFMIWFGFIGMAIGVKNSIHLSIEYFASLLPERYQRWLLRLDDFLVAVFGWYMIQYGWKLYQGTQLTRLPSLGWSRSLLFVMLPIAGIFIILYSLAKIFHILETDQTIGPVSPDIEKQLEELTATEQKS